MTNPVKWIGDDGGWKVGWVVRPDGMSITRWDGGKRDDYLIQHAHTRELEWVESSKLTDYVVDPEYK